MKKWEYRLQASEWVAAAILTVVAIMIHLRWTEHAGALWRDEVATVQFATMSSLREVWTNLAYDNFPPFSLILLRAWIAVFGRSDDALRLFGFAIGLFSLIAFWTAARMFKVRAPLVMLAVVGLSPLAVYTIDSIRPYGAGVCLMCLMTGCFWRMVGSGRVAAAVMAAMTGILSVQCLYQGIAFLFAVACAGIVVTIHTRDYRSMWMVVIAVGLPVLSLLVHLPHLLAGREWGMVAQLEVPLPHLFAVAGAALSESGSVALVGMVTAMVLLPACVMFWCVRNEPFSDKLWFAAISSLVGLAAYMFLVLQTKLPTQQWYYVILIAFAALCLDAASFHSSIARWSRVLFATLATITSIWPAWSHTQVRQTNIDIIARMVRASDSAGDLVIVNPWYCGISWNYYFVGPTSWTTVPPLSDLRIHRYDLLREQMVRNDQEQVVAPITERIRDTLKAGNKVWLVGGLPTAPPGTRAPTLLAAPLTGAKWSGEAYQAVWGMQLAWFLRAHALRFEKVAVETNRPVNPFENLSLGVLNGWRD